MLLNLQQQEAVDTLDSSLLVIAGAGTGKTRVLVTRAATIIQSGRAAPHQVVLVTFTKKAAQEMRERLTAILGEKDGKSVNIGTFHAVSMEMLRFHAAEIGFRTENFTPIDDSEQVDLIQWLLSQQTGPGGGVDMLTAKMVHQTIMNWKEEGLGPEDITEEVAKAARKGGAAREVYPLYQDAMIQRNVCDIPDLLLHVVRLLRRDDAARAYWRKRFRYILVDELQDANTLQYEWLRLVTGETGNVCGVGDTRQAIYEWRNAKPELMLEFSNYWIGAKVVPIVLNYRSTHQIVEAANKVVAKDEGFAGSELIAQKKGQPVFFRTYRTDFDEVDGIADEVAAEVKAGREAHEIAILYRTTQPMEAMRIALEKRGIACLVTGGQALAKYDEVKDILAYLKLANNPYDTLSWMRIADKPLRGVGQRISGLAADRSIAAGEMIHQGIRNVANDVRESLTETRRRTLLRLADNLEDLSFAETRGISLVRIIDMVLDDIGYRDWRAGADPERADACEDLYRQLRRFAERYSGSIQDFVTALLVSDEAPGNITDMVQIMTMHASKGLEFDVVYCPMMVEGVTPHFNACRASKDPMEERRLVHVAWTRARKHLRLSMPKLLNFEGTQPSRYLVEGAFVSLPASARARRKSKKSKYL